jgi:RecA/RadA recombinase
MAPNDKAAGSKAGDREKSLETALAQIERQFGRGAVMRLGDDARAPVASTRSTRSTLTMPRS